MFCMVAVNMNILHEFWFVKDCYSIFGKFPGRLSEKYPASIHFWKRKNNRCCWNRTSSNFVNSQIYQFWNKVPCIHTVLESEEQQLFLEQDFTSNLVDSQSFQFKKKYFTSMHFWNRKHKTTFVGIIGFITYMYLNSNFGIYSGILSDLYNFGQIPSETRTKKAWLWHGTLGFQNKAIIVL